MSLRNANCRQQRSAICRVPSDIWLESSAIWLLSDGSKRYRTFPRQKKVGRSGLLRDSTWNEMSYVESMHQATDKAEDFSCLLMSCSVS
jgi:hypothetical protein